MHQTRLLLLISIYWLTACFSGEQTATPVAPTSTPQSSSLADGSATPFPPIVIDSAHLQTYTHSTAQFSISYPFDWLVVEQANGAIFIDPTQQALYSVFFSQSDTAATPTQLQQAGLDFITRNEVADFEIDAEIIEQQQVHIQFKGTDPTRGTTMNELIVSQEGDWVYFRLLTLPETQWTQTAFQLQHLLTTLIPTTPEASAQSLTPAAEESAPPVWIIYGHPDEKFTFIYPDNWQLVETETSAEVSWPETQMSLRIMVEDIPNAGQDAALLESFAQAQTNGLAETADQFEARPLEAYQAGQGTGFTQDYLYADPSGIAIAESIIVTGIENKLYLITISAPAVSYEAALEWFNPMLQSFQLLPDE